MNSITLSGCAPTPLAHYLKALGVFRIVSEQLDAKAKAAWRGGAFVLQTDASREELLDFFANRYAPTPIVTPWNGGSGFYTPNNAKGQALKTVKESTDNRLTNYRVTICRSERILARLQQVAKPSTDAQKSAILTECRNQLPEAAIEWLDTIRILVSGETMNSSALTGSGGNDGNLDFSNNFLQRVIQVFQGNQDQSGDWLVNSLFGTTTENLAKVKPGQFNPGARGDYNATTGFAADELSNPWDYVFSIEGCLLYAGAATKRLGILNDSAVAFPFSVYQSPVGYASAGAADEIDGKSKGVEIWMPLWDVAATITEIRAVFSEGRITLGKREAQTGVDAFRAVAAYGFHRGIGEFERYGILQRHGQGNHFATPLGRVKSKASPSVRLLDELDSWIVTFSNTARTNKTTPSSVRRALRRIEDAIIRFCKQPEQTHAQQLLIAFGEGEKSMADSFRWTKENYLQPLFGLSPRWIELAEDGSAEFRLAASLASLEGQFGKYDPQRRPDNSRVTLRHHLEPIKTSKTSCWWGEESDRRVVWHDGELTSVLSCIFQRRLLIEQGVDPKSVSHFARIPASLSDIAEFIEGRVDERRIAKLLWAFSLIDFGQQLRPPRRPTGGFSPPSFYALLKLCYPWRGKGDEQLEIPVVPMIHRRAADGQGTEASRLASRRLRASGFAPAVREIAVEGDAARRAAAALLFPIWPDDIAKLKELVTRPAKDSTPDPELILTEITS